MPSPVFALTGCSALKSPSSAAVFICVAMWPGFSRSTLFSAITTGTPRPNTREAMKRSPAPIRSRQSSTRRTASISSKDVVDRALHPLGQRSRRALEPGQVGEHELGHVLLAVRDPEDAAARRLRLVGDDRDLVPADRVHERRLADVGPSRDDDESALHAPGTARCPAAARTRCTWRSAVLAPKLTSGSGTRAATGGSRRTARR